MSGEVAVEHGIETIERQVDAVVGDAALREIVGPNALGTVPRTDERFSLARFLGLLFGLPHGVETCGEHGHGARLVLRLRAFVLTFHGESRRKVRDAHGRVGLLHVLAAGARGAEDVDAKILGGEIRHLDRVEFRQDGDRGGRRVDASLGFGDGDALHAVHARFELEGGVGGPSDDSDDDFAVTAEVARIFRDDFGLPAPVFRVAQIHAQKIPRKEGGFVAARAGPDFEKEVLFVVRILGEEGDFEVVLDRLHAAFGLADFLFGVRLPLWIVPQRLGGFEILLRVFVGAAERHDGFDVGALLGEVAQAIRVARDVGRREHTVDFLETAGQCDEFRSQSFVHGKAGRRGRKGRG